MIATRHDAEFLLKIATPGLALLANAHVPANAGKMFNGCAVVFGGGAGGGGATQEPGPRCGAELTAAR
jgi:hypothetical protein